ncbi:hypothetical protein FHS01_003696 [Longimicrobium terrae]|uniref:Uncharacterized protein n=1 Tax=Longimicrobium terrae TaxID=1639882 RepID=A0A841H1N2_9BACT|nr:hypothetical protein [Longimicrobium terrae]MBB6072035.1 hypothetical protein [Longimicrobium terrae]
MTKRRRRPRPWDGVPARSIVGIPIVVIASLVAFAYAVLPWDRPINRCIAEYAVARTAEGSSKVDVFIAAGRATSGTTCGMMRRDGTIARHQASRRTSAGAR